jgi:hypothetical protein
MPNEFPYDVFLSHSAKDKAVVRPLAERLRVTVREHLTACFSEPRGSALGQSVLHPPGADA